MARRIVCVLGMPTVVLLVCSCSTVQTRLNGNEIAALRSVSTAVVYIKPAVPLYAYVHQALGMDTPGVPVDLAGEQGVTLGALGAVAGEISYELEMKKYDAFKRAFDMHKKVVDALGIPNDLYRTVHSAVSAVPWYQDLTWKRVSSPTPIYFDHETVLHGDTEAMIFITPMVMMRIDADELRIECRISIWFKNPDNKFDVHIFDLRSVVVRERIIPTSPMPRHSAEAAFDALSVSQRMNAIFLDNGALFQQILQGMLGKLHSRLIYFFTGTSVRNGATYRGQ